VTRDHRNTDVLEHQLATRLARRLDESTADLAPDLAERLRFSRERALARARVAHAQAAPAWTAVGVGRGAQGMALAGAGAGTGWGAGPLAGWSGGSEPGTRSSWVTRLAALLPLLILGLGLLTIQDALLERQIEAAAEVDTALLADDLPPQAYSDPGFAEFLRRQER